MSDDRGAVFSKSLERHLYTTTGSETDFTAITSLRGVYMTSVLTEGESTHLLSTRHWTADGYWITASLQKVRQSSPSGINYCDTMLSLSLSPPSLSVFRGENVNFLFLLALQTVWWRLWSRLTRALNGRRCALHRAASVTPRPRQTGPRE